MIKYSDKNNSSSCTLIIIYTFNVIKPIETPENTDKLKNLILIQNFVGNNLFNKIKLNNFYHILLLNIIDI